MGCLQARGHDVVAPDLPLHDPNTGFGERAHPALGALDGAADPLVAVGQSMGSAYATLVAAATPRLAARAPVPEAGRTPATTERTAPIPGGLSFPANRPDGTSVWDPEAAIGAMYRRLAPDSARALAQHLRPTAQPAGEYPLSSHPVTPTALVYAADDETFDPAWERFMAREMLGIEPIEIPGGHFPTAEDPEALADLLDALARELI